MSKNSALQSISDNITHAVRSGVIHLETKKTDTTIISNINNSDVINFSSYSYLGLERNEKLIQGCINAAHDYGTQFGFSRAYISVDLYETLERELSEIFENFVVVAPSTTLAHQSALPVIIGDDDTIILDQFAHASMHEAVKSIRTRGVSVQIIRHNNLELLEKYILEFKKKDAKIWYLCDGVYSMHGDYAPVKRLEFLMDQYPNFHVYIDDAHGMSWCGENGKGFVLSKIKLHRQMVMVTSLNKAFAAAGGALILPTPDLKQQIRNCGNTLIFSTPIQPPMLGAGIASCLLHQTPEIYDLQQRLERNIKFCINRIKELNLPEISQTDSPIFFIPCCFPKVSYNVSKRMLKAGYYLTPTAYPAVSPRKSGLRFCISAEHTIAQIDAMLETLSKQYHSALVEEGVELAFVFKSFKLKLNHKLKIETKQTEDVKIEKYSSIVEIDTDVWDGLLGNNGLFDKANLRMYENTFNNHPNKEDNWKFHYFIVRDESEKIVLATFFTECLLKEDIFKQSEISRKTEIKRRSDKYYLCNYCLLMGTPITEGQHFYLDKHNQNWQGALLLFFDAINKLQFETGINALFLRDFEDDDQELSNAFMANGFIKTDLPDFSHILYLDEYKSFNEFLKVLPQSKRRKVVYEALKYENSFRIKTASMISDSELKMSYQLYLNVQKNSLEINTFALPFAFFEAINQNIEWEFILLYLTDPLYVKPNETNLVGVVLCHQAKGTYTPLFMGLNYLYKYSHNIYKQIILQIVKRPIELKQKRVNLGITASLHKTRYGAIATGKKIYVQMQDTFNQEQLAMETAEAELF